MPSCFHYCFTGGGGKKSLKLLPLYRCDLPVLPLRDSLQSQVHDPETFEFLYLIAQILTHPSDLAVQALGEYDPEAACSGLHHLAGSCHCIQDRYSCTYPADKAFIYWFIYCHKVFFFMAVSGAHDLIYQVSFIGEKEQALRFLVQSAHRIDPQGIIQVFCYSGFLTLLFCTADNSSGFVK